jgi:hypothetical protein
MSYHVLVNDTFCSTDQSHRYTKREYETYGEALAVCWEIVDRFLRHECAPGVPSSAVYVRYMMCGKDPSITEDLSRVRGPGRAPCATRPAPESPVAACSAAARPQRCTRTKMGLL